jgi:adenosylcobyric acid synthase
MGIRGGLMVCGTGSDAGKSTIVAGLCRLLNRRGVRVAPFKAQNMALNSAVTPDGHEIGRAQASQAWAAGVEPEVSMNPILLKPTSPGASQVIVMGRPWAVLDAASYQRAKTRLWPVVTDQLAQLRERFDVVLCEGAGSPAEVNLLDGDIVNLRLAVHAGLRSLVVGDIDRGGVFASLYGTVSLLPDDLASSIGGFVINKFRGDPALLKGGPEELLRRTGLPTLGVLPWLEGLGVDAEDSLALSTIRKGLPALDGTPQAREELDVAVIRLPRISNFTDVDALSTERGVAVRLVSDPSHLGHPDLLVIPGTKSTVADLGWLRTSGLARAIADLAAHDAATVTLGICGGYQMLGTTIEDRVESCAGIVEGLGLLPAETRFETDKVTRRVRGTAWGHEISGYEVRHGRTVCRDPWVEIDGGPEDGSAAEGGSGAMGSVLGTSVHGMFEADGFRKAFLSAVAARAGKAWTPEPSSFAQVRAARYEVVADALEAHLDMRGVEALISEGRLRGPARRVAP